MFSLDWMQEKALEIEDCEFWMVGAIAEAADPLTLWFKGNFLDKNWVTYGFNL